MRLIGNIIVLFAVFFAGNYGQGKGIILEHKDVQFFKVKKKGE